MGASDVVIWLMAGLAAGWLAGAINPGMSLARRLVVMSAGATGGLLGGWAVGTITGTSAVGFLGAASIAVLAAMSSSVLPRRQPIRRYHI
jgi:uncharacterized membrane protein YeaQ/YmgE (transglycosylase-associated protein family)